MKTLFLTLILTFVFGSVAMAETKNDAPIKVSVGKQKKFSRSKITVKFVSVEEDSRCPEGVNCVWAGNAKIKVQLGESGKAGEMFELNTNVGAKGATVGSYAVSLVSLTPTPKNNIRINQNGYTATFSIVRLSR